MSTLDPWQELLKGLELAEEHERNKPIKFKEYRLYYNSNGTIIGLWETDHPDGDNYIVLSDPDIFNRTNSNLLRVVNKELKIIDPRQLKTRQLYKSTAGYRVVQGHAAILLNDEIHQHVEYYDRKNNY
jgi:hypothetical protein